MDVKGAKRFRPIENAENGSAMRNSRSPSPNRSGFPDKTWQSASALKDRDADASQFDFEEFDIKQAKAIFRKLSY